MGFHQRVPSGLFSSQRILSEPGERVQPGTPSATHCHGCGGRVTSTATSCFHCGRPLRSAEAEEEEEDRLHRALTAFMTSIVIVGACSAVWFGLDIYVLNPMSEPVKFDQNATVTSCVGEGDRASIERMASKGWEETSAREGMRCFKR